MLVVFRLGELLRGSFGFPTDSAETVALPCEYVRNAEEAETSESPMLRERRDLPAGETSFDGWRPEGRGVDVIVMSLGGEAREEWSRENRVNLRSAEALDRSMRTRSDLRPGLML